MSAATLNNAVTTTTGSGSVVNATAPTSIAVGDLLLAAGASTGGGQITATGFTVLASNSSWYLLGKYATASDVGAATFTFNQVNSGQTIILMALVKGGDTELSISWETPISTPTLGTASASVTAPTTAANAADPGNNELLVCFYLALTAAGAITVPGTLTGAGEGHSNGCSGIVGYQNISATGATGTRVATAAAAVNNCGFALLIRPSHLSAKDGLLGGSNNNLGPALNVANWWNGHTAPGIESTSGNPITAPGRNLPWWETDIVGFGAVLATDAVGPGAASVVNSTGLFTVDVSGYFSGTIVAATVPQYKVRVNVHWRPTWQPIHTVYTAVDGTWATPPRFRVGDPRYVITVEAPSTGTVYDDLIVDKPLPLA